MLEDYFEQDDGNLDMCNTNFYFDEKIHEYPRKIMTLLKKDYSS